MAASPSLPGGVRLGQLSELRQRIFFLLGALVVYRIGTFIPVPGVNPQALAEFFTQQQGTILDMFNMFSGGALERASLSPLVHSHRCSARRSPAVARTVLAGCHPP